MHCRLWMASFALAFAGCRAETREQPEDSKAAALPAALPDALLDAARAAFAKDFAGAQIEKLERVESTSPLFVPPEPDLCDVSFTRAGIEGSATYGPGAVLVSSRVAMKFDELPEAVRASSRRAWIGAHVARVEREELRAAESFVARSAVRSVFQAGASRDHVDLAILVRPDGTLASRDETPTEEESDASADDGSSGEVLPEPELPAVEPDSPPLDAAARELVQSALGRVVPSAEMLNAVALYAAGTAPPSTPCGYSVDFGVGENTRGTLNLTTEGLAVQLDIDTVESELPAAVAATVRRELGAAKTQWLSRRDDLADLRFQPLAAPRVMYRLRFEDGDESKWIAYDDAGRLLVSEDSEQLQPNEPARK